MAGLEQLKMKNNLGASFRQTTAAKLATASPATGQRTSSIGNRGTSFGIFAQRTGVGTGAVFSNKAYFGASLDAQRRALNANTGFFIDKDYRKHFSKASNAYDDMNKFAAALAATKILGEGVASIIKATKSDDTSGTKAPKGSAAAIINNLKNAKTSGDIEKGLSEVKSKLSEMKTKMPELQKNIDNDTKTKADTQTKLDKTNDSISSEKQNITKQEGIITKLDSSIGQLDAQISELSSKKVSGNALIERDAQLSKLKQQKAELIKQKENAEAAKKTSENKLQQELEPAKEKYQQEISNLDKSIKENTSKRNKMETEQKELTTAQTTYSTKLTTQATKDGNKLRSLQDKINQYKNDFNKETNTNKKNKISTKYTSVANEFNTMLGTVSSDLQSKYQKVEANLDNA